MALENAIADTNQGVLDQLYEKDIIRQSQTLSEGYRTVFNMYAVEGFSHKEIAMQLSITESTSKSQFSRAKALLRNLIHSRTKKVNLVAEV